MTTRTVERDYRSSEAGALPGPTKVWKQFGFGNQIGFRGRESVSIAASFFERRAPVDIWNHDDAGLVRTERTDGSTVFVDPATGEIYPDRPTAHAQTIDTATGHTLERRTRTAGRRWAKTDPEADGPPMVIERYRADEPTLPQPPVGYGYAGLFTEIEFYEPATGRTVDTAETRSTLVNEKLSAPIDYTAVITPGTFGVRCHDPRDASDPPEVTDIMEWDDDAEQWVMKPTAIREPITEFSAKSKARMVRRILSIPWGDYIGPGEQLMMVTLTANPAWRDTLGTKDQSYKALRRFEKRMADRTKDRCRMFWHLEFQRRGAPHWHCLMVLPLTIDGQAITQVVSRQWYEAVGSGDPKHLAAGTRIDFDESIKGTDPLRVALYFAGYSTKTGGGKDKSHQFEVPDGWADTNGSVGRWWGKFGVTPAVEEIRIDAQAVVKAKRLFRARERAQRGRVAVEDLSPERKRAWDRKGRIPDQDGNYTTPLMGGPKRRNRGPARVTDHRMPVGTSTPVDFGADEELWCTLPDLGSEYGPDYQPTRPSRRRRYVSSFKGPTAGATIYLNDAPQFAIAVARHLTRLTAGNEDPPPVGMRGTAAQRLANRRGRDSRPGRTERPRRPLP